MASKHSCLALLIDVKAGEFDIHPMELTLGIATLVLSRKMNWNTTYLEAPVQLKFRHNSQR